MWHLLSLLESGDIPGYRAAAGKLLSRFRKASDPNSLNNAAWACTYVPDAVADLTVPVQMAEAAVAGYPADQKRFALNTLGAALYRAGRIDEAIVRLDESVKAGGGGVPQDWVFLAMAHHKKGNARRGPPLARKGPSLRQRREDRLLDRSGGDPVPAQGGRGACSRKNPPARP